MAMAVRNTRNPEELQIVIHKVDSVQFRSPSCDLVQNTSTIPLSLSYIYPLPHCCICSIIHTCKADKV